MPLLILLLLVWMPLAAISQEAPRRLVDASETCPVTLPDWATPSERYAWDRICKGQTAVMSFAAGSDDGAGCDARAKPEDWPEERRLSPRFVTLVTARTPYTEVAADRAVRIRCAVIPDRLDLAEERIGQTLWLNDSHLPWGAMLSNARIDGDLMFIGSKIDRGLTMHGAVVTGNLFLRNGVFQQVNAINARIGGDLTASGVKLTGLFNADRIEIGGELYLHGESDFEEVRLRSATVHGNLSTIGSRFSGTFEAARLAVGGGLYLREDSEFQKVQLLGARVDGNLEANGSRFKGHFNADAVAVGGGLYMRGGGEFTSVDLTRAQIGGNAQLFGSTFADRIDMTGFSAHELSFYHPNGGVAQWGDAARLILRNADVGSLQARLPDDWARSDGSALPIDPVGFTYGRLGGLGSGDGYDLSEIDAGFVAAVVRGPFLAVQGRSGFVPQPYFQLERVLRDMGAERAADRVALARHERRMDWLWSQGQRVRWAGEWLWNALTGFGIRPFRVLWWFGALVVAGALVAGRSARFADRPAIDSFWYSLENALPLVTPAGDHEGVTHRRVWIDSFFHFQKIAGFVLATVLVGALTLLGG